MCNYLKLVWQQSEILSEAATIVFLLFKMNQIVILAFLSMVLCSIARANVVGPVNEKGNQKNLVFFQLSYTIPGSTTQITLRAKKYLSIPKGSMILHIRREQWCFYQNKIKAQNFGLSGPNYKLPWAICCSYLHYSIPAILLINHNNKIFDNNQSHWD